MNFFRSIFIFTAMMIVFSAPSAIAQPYVEEYNAYVDALKAGDKAQAAKHAKAAWQAAEKSLGDDPATAVLAYNYALLIYMSRPQDAVAPITRTVALIDAGISDIPPHEPHLIRAYVVAVAAPDDSKALNALQVVLDAREDASIAATELSALAWLRVALFYLSEGESSKAIRASEHAETHFKIVAPDEINYQGNALIVNAAAYLMKRARTEQDIVNAHDAAYRAIFMYPPQENIETFDPHYAAALVWHYVVHSFAKSDAVYTSTRLGEVKLVDDEGFPRMWRASTHPEECDIEWKKRKPPFYPTGEEYAGYMGGAMVGYHFDADLNVTEARIIAEVPNSSPFGKAALKAIKTYSLAKNPGAPESCSRNWTTHMLFIIE